MQRLCQALVLADHQFFYRLSSNSCGYAFLQLFGASVAGVKDWIVALFKFFSSNGGACDGLSLFTLFRSHSKSVAVI